MKLQEKIARSISTRREQLNMTKADLCNKTGITYRWICKIENGGNISMKLLDKILDALDMEIVIKGKE